MLEEPSDASIELMVAVYQNNPEAIERACASDADILLKDKDGNSLLMVAAHMNHVDCISKPSSSCLSAAVDLHTINLEATRQSW